MTSSNPESTGLRIKRYREERGLSLTRLASEADISKSYLSELESGQVKTQGPSAEVLYRIAKALGVAMSDLLGRPVLIQQRQNPPPPSLLKFATDNDLPEADIAMLAQIEFRGEQPQTPERWSFIYQAIRNSRSMDS